MIETSANPDPTDHGRLQRLVDALSSPVRREILWRVWEHELTAGEIATHVDVTKATLSTHLATLRRAGLVDVRAEGTFRHYRAVAEAVDAVRHLLASGDERWIVADDLPEAEHAASSRWRFVEVSVEVRGTPAEVFESFTDERRFSDFMGVPVRIVDGRFSCTLEWGTEVRGTYEVVSPPDLIALRWDFDDGAVPVPGQGLVGYLRVTDAGGGRSTVVVHQSAADDEQAEFMAVAWSMVLGRLNEFLERGTPRSRRKRPKRATPRATGGATSASGPS